MQISDFDFTLPESLIAQEPPQDRSASRLLLVDRSTKRFADRKFIELPELLTPGDLVILNNTKVFPARLFGRSESGAGIEIFLVEEITNQRWEVLARPARRLKAGKRIAFDEVLTATVVEQLGAGKLIVEFDQTDIHESLNKLGRTPLPPYIKRERSEADRDRERYQTVYARNRGAIAAPTAGLHFTQEIFAELSRKGIETCEITLHVGYGTFEPVRETDISKHSVLPERFEISENAAEKLNLARSEGRRLVAIGTTTTRTLENAFSKHGEFRAESSYADLTVTPGYKFNAVGAMLTNFHLPKSSLLILVSTFSGHQLIMESYRHAVAARYRFYSYGDCMLIV